MMEGARGALALAFLALILSNQNDGWLAVMWLVTSTCWIVVTVSELVLGWRNK